MTPTYMTRAELIARFPVPKTRPGLRNWIKRNGFPAPIYANANCPLWSPDDGTAGFDKRPRNLHDALAAAQAALAWLK